MLKNVKVLFSGQFTELFKISNHNEKISVGYGDTEIEMIIEIKWLAFCNVYSHDIIP